MCGWKTRSGLRAPCPTRRRVRLFWPRRLRLLPVVDRARAHIVSSGQRAARPRARRGGKSEKIAGTKSFQGEPTRRHPWGKGRTQSGRDLGERDGPGRGSGRRRSLLSTLVSRPDSLLEYKASLIPLTYPRLHHSFLSLGSPRHTSGRAARLNRSGRVRGRARWSRAQNVRDRRRTQLGRSRAAS
jgi:hypothetical protein